MGRTEIIPLVLEINERHGNSWVWVAHAWKKRDGSPTEANIGRWIEGYIQSQYPGGCNHHLAEDAGYVHVPNEARIIRQPSMQVVATWKAPAFMAMPPMPQFDANGGIIRERPGKRRRRARLSR